MKTLRPFLIILFVISLVFIFSCKKEKDSDTTSPVITITGDNPAIAGQGTVYTDAGATAYDETDGDITSGILTTNNVNTTDTGFYQVKYNISDHSGNAAEEKIRTVHVIFM